MVGSIAANSLILRIVANEAAGSFGHAVGAIRQHVVSVYPASPEKK
jgi:hypothetical protein